MNRQGRDSRRKSRDAGAEPNIKLELRGAWSSKRPPTIEHREGGLSQDDSTKEAATQKKKTRKKNKRRNQDEEAKTKKKEERKVELTIEQNEKKTYKRDTRHPPANAPRGQQMAARDG